MGYGIKIGGTQQYTKVAKPVLNSDSLIFNNSEQSADIVGYDPLTMTRSGVYKATASGTYSVVFTLNKHCKWVDGDKSKTYSITWNIAKKKLTIPSLSTTSYAYIGNTIYPSVNNFNSSLETASGDTYANRVSGSLTIKWSLKDSSNYCWTDGSIVQKSANWSTYAGTISYTIRVQEQNYYSQSTRTCAYGQTFNDVCPVTVNKSERTSGGSSDHVQFMHLESMVIESRGVAINFEWTDWYAGGHSGYHCNTSLPGSTMIQNNTTYTWTEDFSYYYN